MRVLLIEDDRMLGEGLALALRDAGMSVDWVQDGLKAEVALENGGHAIALLGSRPPIHGEHQDAHDPHAQRDGGGNDEPHSQLGPG